MDRTTTPDDLAARHTRADLLSVVLVKAAAQGQREFLRAWADVRAWDRPAVVDALTARAALDNLVHGYTGAVTSTLTLDLGAQAARAAFQLAGSLVADALWRETPRKRTGRARDRRHALSVVADDGPRALTALEGAPR